MTTIALPLAGSCRCGQLEIRITKAPICTAACHCPGCRKMSSSAYSLTAMVPADGFEVVKGEPVIGGLHGADIHHYFCPHCMTWVFTRPVGMDFVNVRPTMFDDTSWFRPYMETYASTRLPFAETGAVRSFETFPTMEDIEGLVRGYAEWAG
ncbi:aldehyde-activating protein [Mesorhizobium sp. Root157]|uniref:GFA family protein n=1 Tax=Mesorhizobium sp. Root157 TaxID=1736477 RepID=UPI0006F3D621|nr:GFA family protein [Mesorhizobium sp. Root157]KQZ87159.1 aldehyde-activating protein [Mesorhizobium sp. Root157]